MKINWHNPFSLSSPGTPETFQNQADAGGPEAQNNLGVLYTTGGAFPVNYPAAALCFRKAAEKGYALAQTNLARMYALGEGQPRDNAEALKWLRRAATQGDAGAQFHLGVALHRASLGTTTPLLTETKIEAFMWLQLATSQGFFKAETARDQLNLQMSQSEFQESSRRVARFVAAAE